MRQIDNIVQFPSDAQSSPFFGALASALLPALGYTEETPYYCAQKASYCTKCGNCGNKTKLQKYHNTLYHDYQTITGVCFGWTWPELASEYHTIKNAGVDWRWPDEFIAYIMGFAGITWCRLLKGTDKDAVYQAITMSVDNGFPVLVKLGTGQDWHVVTGYGDCILYGLDSHTHYDSSVHPQIKPDRYTEDGLFVISKWFESFEDAIILTGRCKPSVTLVDVLSTIICTLEHPVHARLEADLNSRIDQITPDNAQDTARWLNDIAGFPIEARWHAAESFSSGEATALGMLRLTDDPRVKDKFGKIFFNYVADNNNETHGVLWKVWGQLGVGPETGYSLPQNITELVTRPETKAELKRLFSIVFKNDRDVLSILHEALELVQK